MQQSFDFTRAAQLRDAGIQRAAEHADRETPNWNKSAFQFLKRFLRIRVGPFMIEDFRQWAEPSGLPAPPHNRAYGAVALKAQKMGLIHKIGVKKVKNAKAHCANANIWKAYK